MGLARTFSVLMSETTRGGRLLAIPPGPGLTVVTGRNGSGKSSFAEAAELALTGENKRWADRSAVWKEGWRNLHAPDPTAISVQLTEDGVPGTTTVTRAWAAGAGLESADDVVWAGPAELSLAAKGWLRPLELYRPFLSYSELGALVSGKPTSMHDAMQAILGLDLLTATEKTLTDARRTADAQSKAARQELPALRAALAAYPDERARRAEKALTGKAWDLPVLEGLAVGDGAGTDERVGLLRQVTSITLPAAQSVSAAVSRLSTARSAVAALAGTRAVLRANFGGELDPGDASAAWDAWQTSPTTEAFATLQGTVALLQEAACVDVVRRRFLEAGRPHAEVEESLDRASHSVQDMVALALFGDTGRAREVPTELRAWHTEVKELAGLLAAR